MHLSEYMAARGLDDETVARGLDVTRATVSRIRRRKARPDWATIQKIQTYTGGDVTADDFVQLDEAVA